MTRSIAHRGPDGEGFFLDQRVALGHRRLSIIDVEGGSQPIPNEDGRFQIIFNGEIYNFQELMDGLRRRGHQFRTRSDTEVILHLYEEEGERTPEFLNGMFAFAIWDTRERTLFVARDRFGEKPLYYSTSVPGYQFCFASELKALACLPGFEGSISPRSVAEFLTFSYVPDPGTIYRDVLKLAPAHSLFIRDGAPPRCRSYWTPPFEQESAMKSGLPSAEALDELAGDAVRTRMVSDVPLGAFLSGGVDSSAVTAYMAQAAPDRVKTFSIGFTTRAYDELEYARLIVSRYSTDHREEVVTSNIDEVLPTLVRHYDEPFGDSSAIPTLYLARMTRRHVTVALSGDGADELFGGYRRYAFALQEDRARRFFPSWFRSSVIARMARLYPKFDYLPRPLRAKATLSGIATSLPDSYFNAMSRFGDEGLARILSPELLSGLHGFSVRASFADHFRPFQHLSPLTQLRAVDWKTYLPGDILVKVDRATMAYSLESRAPWLDHRIAEFSAACPSSSLIRGMAGKLLFKQAVAHHIPGINITRPKMGFAVPMPLWFRTALKPRFEAFVLHPSMAEYFHLPAVAELWRQHQSGRFEHSSKLWNIFMLACWHRVHRLGDSPDSLNTA